MKVKELTEILQKHDQDKKIMFINDDSGIYTFDLRYLDTISAEQKYLDNIVVINIKKEVYEWGIKWLVAFMN